MSGPHKRVGFVGLEVTKRPPFIVLAVDDLIDEDYIQQGQPGYANELVMPGDKLLQVDGVGVESTDVRKLHEMLGGSMHSLVELAFARGQGGEQYSVKVRRHGLHEHDRKPGPAQPTARPTPPPAAAGGHTTAGGEVASLRERIKELETERAVVESKLAHSALDAKKSLKECHEVRRELAEIKRTAKVKEDITSSEDKLPSDSESSLRENKALRAQIASMESDLEVRLMLRRVHAPLVDRCQWIACTVITMPPGFETVLNKHQVLLVALVLLLLLLLLLTRR
jgi:hypothetical protein